MKSSRRNMGIKNAVAAGVLTFSKGHICPITSRNKNEEKTKCEIFSH